MDEKLRVHTGTSLDTQAESSPDTMGLMSSNVAIGLCLAVLVSTGAAAAGALTVRAALASSALGTIVFAAGGITWSVPLLTFFVTSSVLSRRTRDASLEPTADGTTRRTARQVVANGSIPGLWAACHFILPGNAWSILFASALATAAADTWATEVGRHSSSSPRDALTLRRVPAGTSGGITVPGLAASVGGATAVTVACLITGVIGPSQAAAIALAGSLGGLVDSLLGSSLQERRWCSTCGEETEDAIHPRCSSSTSYLYGFPGFDNDWVNLSAGAAGSFIGLALTHLL